MNREDVIQAILDSGREGWGDGEGRDLREGARRAAGFISILPESVPAPAVVEGEGGGLTLEWRSADDGILQIEFKEDGGADYWVCSGGIECRGGADSEGELARLIAEAMGG